MDNKNMDTAIDIVTTLMTGNEIGKNDKKTKALYEEFNDNSEVYDIATSMLKKMNLSVYEYSDSIYVSPGDNNRIFGYTNDELKREIGVRLNKELYLCYLIIYNIMTWFYASTDSVTYNDYIKVDDIVEITDNILKKSVDELAIVDMSVVEEGSFKELALAWEDLPMVVSEGSTAKAGKGSRIGMVKMTLNFLVKQDLMVENMERYYPKKRFKAIVTGFYEENKSRLYELLNTEKEL